METKMGWTSNRLRGLVGVVDVMLAQDDVEPFARPATPEDFLGDDKELRLEEYRCIITQPMDFSTVRDRLKRCDYKSSEDCIEDVKLIFTNCKKYNSPRDHVARIGRRLEALFKVLVSKALPREEEVVKEVGMAPPPHDQPSTLQPPQHVQAWQQMPLSKKMMMKVKMVEDELESLGTHLKVQKTELQMCEERNFQLAEDIVKSAQKYIDLQKELRDCEKTANRKISILKLKIQHMAQENGNLALMLQHEKEKFRNMQTKIANAMNCNSSQQGSPPRRTQCVKTDQGNETHRTFLKPMPYSVKATANIIEEYDMEAEMGSSPESSRSIVFGRNRLNQRKRRLPQHAGRTDNITKQRRLF